jgi:hypoxanthine phosphoribosyltransferase
VAFFERDVGVLIDEATLRARVREMGQELTRAYEGKELTLVGVLKGAVFFMTDLARAIDLPLTVEFLGVSSYQGGTETTGEVRITSDVTKPMAGKHLLVVEDIIDTGLTLNYLLGVLREREPSSLEVCVLLDKEVRRIVDLPIAYRGFSIPDRYVVGYGLDHQQLLRNLPFIGELPDEAVG